MRLEVHLVEYRPDRSIADGQDDSSFNRFASQILAGPMGDVQADSNRLQASEFDDLGALEGGNPGRTARSLG
jgi:hypothetical protein